MNPSVLHVLYYAFACYHHDVPISFSSPSDVTQTAPPLFFLPPSLSPLFPLPLFVTAMEDRPQSSVAEGSEERILKDFVSVSPGLEIALLTFHRQLVDALLQANQKEILYYEVPPRVKTAVSMRDKLRSKKDHEGNSKLGRSCFFFILSFFLLLAFVHRYRDWTELSDYCGIRLVLKPDTRVENVLGALSLLAKGTTPMIQTFRQESCHDICVSWCACWRGSFNQDPFQEPSNQG